VCVCVCVWVCTLGNFQIHADKHVFTSKYDAHVHIFIRAYIFFDVCVGLKHDHQLPGVDG